MSSPSALPQPRFFLRWNLPEPPNAALVLSDSGETVDLTEFAATLIGLGATIETGSPVDHDTSDVLIGEISLDVPDDATFELWTLTDPQPRVINIDDACALLAAAVRALIVEGIRFEADDENGTS